MKWTTIWVIRKTYSNHKESSITRTIDKPWPHSYNHKHKLIPIKHIINIGNKEGRKSYENKYDCKEQKTDVPLLYVLYGWIRFYFHMIYTPECFGEKKKQAVVITIWQRPASFFMCILFGINVWKCITERYKNVRDQKPFQKFSWE